MQELELAHENLAQHGGDRRSNQRQKLDFGRYCEDVGISRQTAYNWLETWKQIKAQYLQLEDDVQIKDVETRRTA